MLEVLNSWMQEKARVAVAYGGQGDWFGFIVAVDQIGLVQQTTQGNICLPWHAVRQVRPVDDV